MENMYTDVHPHPIPPLYQLLIKGPCQIFLWKSLLTTVLFVETKGEIIKLNTVLPQKVHKGLYLNCWVKEGEFIGGWVLIVKGGTNYYCPVLILL